MNNQPLFQINIHLPGPQGGDVFLLPGGVVPPPSPTGPTAGVASPPSLEDILVGELACVIPAGVDNSMSCFQVSGECKYVFSWLQNGGQWTIETKKDCIRVLYTHWFTDTLALRCDLDNWRVKPLWPAYRADDWTTNRKLIDQQIAIEAAIGEAYRRQRAAAAEK